MTLVNYKPIEREINDYFNFANKMLGANTARFSGVRHTSPTVNIRETAEIFELELVAAGLKKEDFAIEIDKNVLTISFEQEEKKEVTEGQKYLRKEYIQRSFKRSFRLPETVNQEAIAGKYEAGILTMTLPKKEVEPAKKIEIS